MHTVSPFVRNARPGDETAIGMIHVASWQETYQGYMPQDFLDGLDVSQRIEFWRQRLLTTPTAADQRRSSRGVVVMVDESSQHQEGGESIIGFAMFGPSRDVDVEDNQRLTGEVDAIYLQPGSTGKGFGRLLMNAVITELAQSGYEEVILWVLDNNARARRFYEGLGWAADGSVKEDSIRGRFTIREVRYRRSLVGTSITGN